MRQRDFDDDDSLPVVVPHSDKALVAISAKRASATAARTPDSGITRIANGDAFEALRLACAA